MICKETVTKFCCEDLSLIENYEQAIFDNSQTWECHHRLEVQDNKIVSRQELINNNLYYNRPANELIFLTCSEHSRLHSSNRTEEVLKKVSESQKGRKFSQEHCEKLSKAHSGKHPWNYGKKVDSIHMQWFNNGTINIRSGKCPEGFVPGRINTFNEDCRKALSEKISKTRWWNNGIINTRAEVCPPGFVLGKLKKLNINCYEKH